MGIEEYEAVYRYYATRAAQVARGVVLKTDAFNECGRRWWTVPIVDKLSAESVTVVEVDGARAAICAERFPDVDIVHGDLCAVEFQRGMFDTILDLSTLDHIRGWESVLESYRAWLKEGGSLLLICWVGERFVDRGLVGSDMEYTLPGLEVEAVLTRLFGVFESREVMRQEDRVLTEYLCEAR